MTGPLDDLLAEHGLPPVVPVASGPPSFSVIVRTQGRRPNSLCEAVEALAAQDHTDFEVLVVVHGDEATAREVGDRLDSATVPPRLEVSNVEGGGRSRPLNAGLDAAIGHYICVLDDDDLVTSDWLAAFARAASDKPGTVIRAVTRSQRWTTEGGDEPVAPVGAVETPFPATFDLLAHMSRNETPVCSLALPRAALDHFHIRFDESLPVMEDWDLLMRLAMLVGVTSIPDETSLYRRLDSGNADTAEQAHVWDVAHALVIDRLSARPVLMPTGDARRIASAHFVPGGGSRHDADLQATRAELAALTRSPLRWLAAFAQRLRGWARHRTAGLRS